MLDIGIRLSEIFVNKTITKYPEEYPEVSTGGYYRPKNCKSRHKVAVLVPYRDRKKDLFVYLHNIHPFLIRQKLEYRIFVIEQKGTDVFNRGKLFNAGFVEIKKYGIWRCVIFHDVDLLPLDDRILYSCPTWPKHMCATVAEVKKPKFRSLFGGVSSMDVQQFQQVNGYSNLYWGWGGEDNDLFWRIRAAGLPIVRNRKDIARYTTLKHSVQSPNRLRFALLSSTYQRYKREGISNLKYKVESVTEQHLHTHIIVDINPGKENTTKLISQWIKSRYLE
ncbi:beta-1,4-N-acetylgalactosaminyltransferase bre-4-like [Vanessa tameamea]|uniref:Beta-1,4-N-acetylgalactosaminyltransferase bre-4-like n=1 Tax=Vanessa tameamea TaxID=334116 RepID=A0ABM4AQT0_VANTA